MKLVFCRKTIHYLLYSPTCIFTLLVYFGVTLYSPYLYILVLRIQIFLIIKAWLMEVSSKKTPRYTHKLWIKCIDIKKILYSFLKILEKAKTALGKRNFISTSILGEKKIKILYKMLYIDTDREIKIGNLNRWCNIHNLVRLHLCNIT